MKKVIAKILKKALNKIGVKLNEEEIEKRIKTPPSLDMGDYSFPVFFLTDQTKKLPDELALELREKIGNIPETDFDDVQTSGGYINFFIDRKDLARKVVWEAITQNHKFGSSKIGAKKRIVVEFSSPNIAKPFGIGHLRSTIIGNSLANIAEFLGYKPVRINYLGDWGTQFGKLIFGFENLEMKIS
ncbi:arginine--tRNA ligase [Candidatus Pacearchaeota archaeon]|nr:MAG: arginine--tRNA ligase [Candidatus Pacearchaeota archaeon]